MSNSFDNFIADRLRKSGCVATAHADHVAFENDYLRGSVTLKKPFTVTWKTKRGYNLFDVPMSAGNSSASFKDVGLTLSFIRRRLLR